VALLLVVFSLACVSYAPVLGLVNELPNVYVDGVLYIAHNGSLSGAWWNVIMDGPEALMPDFFCGVFAAAFAKSYRPGVSKWLASAEGGVMRKYAVPLLLHVAADGMIAVVVFLTLRYVPEDDATDADYLKVVIYKTATLPTALYLLFSTLSADGFGLFTIICRSPSLIALGRYSLHVFVFQVPCSRIWYHLFTGETEGRILMEGDQFMWYVVALWAFAAGYAEYVEEPLVQLVQRLISGKQA
jgi:hypothetical protein